MHLSRLRGLDPWSALVSTALTAFKGGSAGGGSEPQAQPISVSTSVSTQASPQISPVFVQQDQPQSSPVSVATVQANPLPGTPITGAIPGVDAASGFLPTGTALAPAFGGASPGVIAAGLGIVGLAFFLTRKRKGRGRRR